MSWSINFWSFNQVCTNVDPSSTNAQACRPQKFCPIIVEIRKTMSNQFRVLFLTLEWKFLFFESWMMPLSNYNFANFLATLKVMLICIQSTLDIRSCRDYFCVTCCKQRWHIGITSPSSVCLSVRPSVCLSVLSVTLFPSHFLFFAITQVLLIQLKW